MRNLLSRTRPVRLKVAFYGERIAGLWQLFLGKTLLLTVSSIFQFRGN